MYSVSADPGAATISLITTCMSSAQLTVSYNTYCNVSIVATSCGQNSVYTGKFITLHTQWLKCNIFFVAVCDYPLRRNQ